MKDSIRIVLGTAAILLVPLIAMQFTDEVKWDLVDFVVMGALLLAVGFTYKLIATKLQAPVQRFTLVAVLLLVFLLVWADLAVGIFNIPGFSGS